MELLIMGKVTGVEKVKEMFNKAPDVFRKNILSWLLKENEMFIGSKKTDGVFRRELMKRKTWAQGQSWSSRIVKLFKGMVVDALTGQVINQKSIATGAGTGVMGRGFSMTCKMGMFYRNKKSIHTALEFLEEGGSISSDKYMPVPVKGINIENPGGKFRQWLSTGQFKVIYKNGLALYFLQSRLMFVGRKMVQINYAHHFNQMFDARRTGIDYRAAIAVDKAATEAQHG